MDSRLATHHAARERPQLTRTFGLIALVMAAFFVPFALWNGRHANAVFFATGAVILLGMQWLGRRNPNSTWPALGTTIVCVAVLLLGPWQSGGVESAAVAWIPACFALAVLLLPRKQALCVGAGVLATVGGMVACADLAPVVPRSSVDTAVDLFGASITTALLSYVFLQSQRTYERDLARTVVELENEVAARGQAELHALAAAQTKARFLATVGHELRTPLNGVMGMTQLLGTTQLSPDQRKMLEALSHSGDLLVRLIEDTLTFTALEAGQTRLRCQPFSIHDTVVEVVTLLDASAGDRVHVEAVCSPRVPAVVEGDPDRVRQVLLNLGDNAIKFTGEGTVTISLDRADDGVRLTVRDRGPGIQVDQHERIFEAFVQLDDSDRRQHGGAGLGLAVVKGLVTAMGGGLEVESAPGDGTTVHVYLPLGTPVSTTDGCPAACCGELPRLRVLLVEDNPVSAAILGRMFDALGVSWTHCSDSAHALTTAFTQPFDLVLMDLQMPQLDGLATARELRFRGLTAPIVALTADASPGDRTRCFAAGMQDYLPKPVRFATLEALLHRWAGGGDQQGASAFPPRSSSDGRRGRP